MSQFTCQFAELDDETKEYLREVRRRAGDRTPGVYVQRTNGWPVAAILLGPVVIVAGVLFALGSAKDAWAVAMLLTAALLLGGWMVVYAFRRWLAGNSPRFAGYFTYFDPAHVYRADGDEVAVTDVSNLAAVEVRHNLSQGKYANSTVAFDLKGRTVKVPVRDETRADLVDAFYTSVLWLEAHDDPKWRNLPAAELGGVAKYVAVEDELPRDMKDVDLEVTAAPTEPRKATTAGGGAIPYFVILGVGAALYLALWATMRPTADHLAFEAAKAGGPTGLRAYLLDDRNTLYRDEAKRLLAAHYEPAVRKAEAVNDPALKQGLLALLDGLGASPSPATSIDVREVNPPKELELSAPARTKQTGTELADALGAYLGKDLIAFVMPPEGKPAHVELAYRYDPSPAGYQVIWRLRFRPNPDAPPVEGPERALPQRYGLNNIPALPNGLKQAVFQELFATAPPLVPQVPPGGGDWEN